MQQQEASKRMDFTTQNNQKGKEAAKAEEGKDQRPEGGKYKGVDKDEQGRHKKSRARQG